jgi:hypothetical protein
MRAHTNIRDPPARFHTGGATASSPVKSERKGKGSAMQRSGVTKRSPTVAFPAADNDSDFQDIFSGEARSRGLKMQWSRPRYDGTHHPIMAGHNRSKRASSFPLAYVGRPTSFFAIANNPRTASQDHDLAAPRG